jgi:hypothetical protein
MAHCHWSPPRRLEPISSDQRRRDPRIRRRSAGHNFSGVEADHRIAQRHHELDVVLHRKYADAPIVGYSPNHRARRLYRWWASALPPDHGSSRHDRLLSGGRGAPGAAAVTSAWPSQAGTALVTGLRRRAAGGGCGNRCAHEFLDQSPFIVEPEDVDQVHDDPCAGRGKRAGRRLWVGLVPWVMAFVILPESGLPKLHQLHYYYGRSSAPAP